MMRRLLSACVESGFVVEADCDEVIQQYDDFIHTCANGELENFSVADDRLDTFLRSRMAANYPKAWSVKENNKGSTALLCVLVIVNVDINSD